MGEKDNYCGIDPIVTGEKDPFYIGENGVTPCITHDAAFDSIKAGVETKTPLQTFRRFVSDLVKVTVNKPSAWSILGLPIYILIGGFGGILRQQQLLDRLSPPPKDLED